MDFVIALLVLAAALAILAYPLYRAQQQPAALNASTLDNLLAQRDGVYATLRDLELDKQLGKLDDADYNALHEKYMTQATDLLRQLDTLQGKGSAAAASDALEQEIAALRNKTTNGRTPTPQKALRCANCGRPYKAGDRFCARCGRALN
jgi:hypothetical protein